jgi:MFS family permease
MNLWAISRALIVLGIGWNFLAVGSSTLLTQASTPQERAKTQSINDFLTLGATTLTAFSSAPLHQEYGWSLVNFSAVPALALVSLALSWLKTTRILQPETGFARLDGGSHDTTKSGQHRLHSAAWHHDPARDRRC